MDGQEIEKIWTRMLCHIPNLRILDNILLKNNQILILKNLRRDILVRIHEGHLGVQRCKDLARQSAYWITFITTLRILLQIAKFALPKPEMLPHGIIGIPWFK